MGKLVRAFSTEKLADEDRRDGAPFFVFLLSVFGAVFAWFLINEPWAKALHSYTFGMLFGLVAYALPAIFLIYSLYLFRHPASVRDSSRFAVGFWLFLSVISGFFHIFGGAPSPNADGPEGLALAGGLFGWLIGGPLLSMLTIWGATPVLVVLVAVSVLVMTGTAPNKIKPRLIELYNFLFGIKPKAEIPDAFDGKKSSWWNKDKDEKPAFDTAVVEAIDDFVDEHLL
jgi:S-DNA-T family DNA segregation ATPase FtsK/SpoIIIE